MLGGLDDRAARMSANAPTPPAPEATADPGAPEGCGRGTGRNAQGEWVLLRHALVVQAALDHERFSNAVSSHLQIPNGLDGDEHTAYRAAKRALLALQSRAPSLWDWLNPAPTRAA